MPVPGMPGLSFSLNPSSSAASESGLKSFGGSGGAATGAINIGSGGQNSPFTGLVRDGAIAVAVAYAAVYLWRHMK